MIISLIVAMDENRGIGKDNHIPWHLADDLKRFKRLSMGHPIIMGRKTYKSIGRPLPGRTSIVITRNPNYRTNSTQGQIQIARSLKEALKIAEAEGDNEVFVIGGAEIFEQALPLAERIYLTRVHTSLDCDTFFPPFESDQWQSSPETVIPSDEKNQFSSTFQILNRQSSIEILKG